MGLTLGAVEPGDGRGAARAVHQGPAAGARASRCGSRGRRSTTASCPTTSCWRRAGSASSTTRRARATRRLLDVRAARGGVPVGVVRAAARCFARALRVVQHPAVARHQRPHAHPVPPQRRERARAALPFLRFDRDPYMVIAADGTLKWMLDAYTTTDRYPYAQPLADGMNYMRNSVKVVIDAYDGTVARVRRRRRRTRSSARSRAVYPGLLPPLDRDARRPARAPALSGGSVPRCRRRCTRRTTWRPGDVLPPRGPVAGPGAASQRARAARCRSCATW